MATHVTLNSFLEMQRPSVRCGILPRQRVRRCEQQRGVQSMQSRHLLSGWHGDTVALPRWLLLSGHHWCDECTAPAVPRGVVLQRQWVGCRRALSPGLVVSHSRPVVGAATVSDRISLSHSGVGRWRAVSAGSILPRDGPGEGRDVSVGDV